MARIKIADVPQAPSVAGAAPQAINYPNMPDQRVPYTNANLPGIPQVPEFKGSNARFQAPPETNPAILENPLDLQGKISQLQQTQMDPGPVLAAGRAATQVGLAVASAGRTVGDSLSNLGLALQQSKDMSDISRANNFIRMGQAAYDEEAVNVPLSERQKLWEEKYQPAISSALGAIKMSPYVADRVGPDWQLAQTKQRTSIATEARKEVMKQDEAAILEDMNAAVANGDWVKAADANARLTLGRHQDPRQQSARQRQINEAKVEWDVRQMTNDNPRAALQEMEEAEAGKSDIFPDLKNPTIIARSKAEARAEVNRREVDASEAITEGMAAGTIKSKDDIAAAAGGNLTPDRVEAYNRMLLANPEYSSEAVMKARTAANEYKPETDKDLSQYHAIKEMIATTTPKSEHELLNSTLNSRLAPKSGKGGDADPKQWYATSLLKEIEDLTDNGYFDPAVKPKSTFLGIPVPYTGEAKYDRDKARKDPMYAIKHRDVEEAAWARAKTLQDSMRDWLMANPDASPKDARTQLNSMLSAENARSASQAMKPKIPTKEAVPTAAATPVQKMYPGQLVAGNIDLSNRPIIHNPDGTISSERSFSIEDDGKEVLIPLIVNGKELTQKAAIEHYRKTGEHMGKFDSPASADAAAEIIHNRPMPKEQGPPTSPPLSSKIKLPEAQPVATITAYRPGGTSSMGLSSGVEGGPMDAHGNMILGKTTMEDYAAGRGEYVTVAMDSDSKWQGHYLQSEAYPGVVFKVMDNGGHGNQKTGEGWIDIAWTDPAKARNFIKHNITFQPVDPRTAKQIAAQREA